MRKTVYVILSPVRPLIMPLILLAAVMAGQSCEWEKLAPKLAAMPISKANTRAFGRFMLAGAMDLQLDKQGRVVLPEYLRQFGQNKKENIIAGLYNRLEIWDEDNWNKYKKGTEKQSVDIAEALQGLDV